MMVGKSIRVVVSASVVVAVGLLVVPRRMEAQDPVPLEKKTDVTGPGPPSPKVPPERGFWKVAEKRAEPPDPDIPDDPPPHEGAMFAIPLRIGVPDIIQVEVLEALPGRPIAGERLVRPDGTISLGFYGSIHVDGLTTVQVKEKIIEHLKHYLTDEALGLVAEMVPEDVPAPAVPQHPLELPPGVPELRPAEPKAPEAAPKADPKLKKTTIVTQSGDRTRFARLATQASAKPLRQPPYPVRSGLFQEPKIPQPDLAPVAPGGVIVVDPDAVRPMDALQGPQRELETVRIEPRDSDRVYVDLASYNTHVYFVLGDINKPGRLPWTGKETVLDALQFAGGLDSVADARNIRLARPARGKKPARVYPIDLAAIESGDAKANLQLFPNDRLIIGRSPVSDSTVKLNAEAARTNTLLNTALTYAYVLRTFDRLGETGSTKDGAELSIKLNGSTLKINLGDDAPRIDPARRKEALKAFQEYWSKTSRVGGPEEERVREEMMKLLDK